MRERKTWLVVTFHTTAAAIGMEKLCAARGLAGRLIPVPRALTADCGMAWRAEIDRRAALEALLRDDAVKKRPIGNRTVISSEKPMILPFSSDKSICHFLTETLYCVHQYLSQRITREKEQGVERK